MMVIMMMIVMVMMVLMMMIVMVMMVLMMMIVVVKVVMVIVFVMIYDNDSYDEDDSDGDDGVDDDDSGGEGGNGDCLRGGDGGDDVDGGDNNDGCDTILYCFPLWYDRLIPMLFIYREVFVVDEPVLMVPKLYMNFHTCLLRVVDNDTGEELSRVFERVAPSQMKRNKVILMRRIMTLKMAM